MPKIALLTDGEFLHKLKVIFTIGVKRVVANGKTQLSDSGVALIVEYEEEWFGGFFGNYDPETGELTDVHCVFSNDLWAVKRAVTILGA